MLDATWHDTRPRLTVIVPHGTEHASQLRKASGIAARQGYGGVAIMDETAFHTYEPATDVLLVGAADNLATRGRALQYNGDVYVAPSLRGGVKLEELD